MWIGNWGDGERTGELESFLFRPARDAGQPLDIYGVRYPDDAKALLARYGVEITYYDPLAGAGIAALMRENTRAVLVEAPGSPSVGAARRSPGSSPWAMRL